MAHISNTLTDPDDLAGGDITAVASSVIGVTETGGGIYNTPEMYIDCINKVFAFKAAGNFAAFSQADASLAGADMIITCAPTYVDSTGATVSYADDELIGSRVTITDSTSDDGTYLITDNNATSVTVDYNATTFTTDATITVEIDAGSGVLGQALYSAFKKIWQHVASITKYDFPMLSITNEQFEFSKDWKPTMIAPTRGVSDEITATTKTADSHSGAQSVVPYSESTDIYTRRMIRTAGWTEAESDGAMTRRFNGNITLGSLNVTDQPYYVQDAGKTVTTVNTSYTGPVNEAIQFEGDSVKDTDSAAPLDTAKDTYFKFFVRTRSYTYADADLDDIGVTTLTYIVYRYPVSNAADIDIKLANDTLIDSSVDYAVPADTADFADISIVYLVNPSSGTGDVNITGAYTNGQAYSLGDVAYDTGNSQSDGSGYDRWWYVSATAGTSAGADMNADSQNTWTLWTASAEDNGEREIQQGIYAAFHTVIDADDLQVGNGSADRQKVYEWSQWALRAVTGVIDEVATSQNANIADLLVNYVGDQLHTKPGVMIDSHHANDENKITFHDYVDSSHGYPTVVPININFNSNLVDDTGPAIFRCYYKDTTGDTDTGFIAPGSDFGTANAIEVNKSGGGKFGDDAGGGNEVVSSTYPTNYAYSTDTASGNRTIDEPTKFVTIAIGLDTAQYIAATEEITGSGAVVSLVSALERNYVA